MAIRLPKKFCLTPTRAMITYAWSDWTDTAETYQECSQEQHPFHLLWDVHECISAHLPLWMVNWAIGWFSVRHKTKKKKYTYLPQRLTNVYMELLKGWDVKQHIHIKENERLVQPMQLHVFCWGKFIAALHLSRRVVSHKDFQMPCVKFLISPTILKYIITQMQTSFKKYLSLKHVWPPCLALKRLSFSFLSFLLKPSGRLCCSTPWGPNADLTDVNSNTSSCIPAAHCAVSLRKPCTAEHWCFPFRESIKKGEESLSHFSWRLWRWEKRYERSTEDERKSKFKFFL